MDGTKREIDDDEIDLMSLLDTLRRQVGLIAVTVVFCLALAAIYLFAVTPMYTATALVLVDPAKKDLLDPGAEQSFNQGYANARVESEVEILRSDTVALAVVSEQGLISDEEFGPQIGLREKVETAVGIQREQSIDANAIVRNVVDRFKNATEIRRKGQTFLISVSVSSASPNRAADLANALSHSYITQQVEAKIQSSLAARDVLQSQIITLRGQLAQSEAAFDGFVAANLERIKSETGRTDVASLADVLNSLEVQRLQNEVSLRQSQSELVNRNWSLLAQELESQVLSDLERERTGLQRRLGLVVQGSQASVDLRAEITTLEARLEQVANQEVAGLQHSVSSLSNQEDETRRKMRETLLAGQLPPDLLTEIFEIQQDATNARSQYQNLLARTRDVETQAAVQIADSRLVSAALAPTSASFPKSRMILALAMVLGIGLGVFLAFLREFFIGGFTSAEQLKDALQAPVASVVPLAENLETGEFSPADKMVNAPLSAYAESIRRLRSAIDRSLRPSTSEDDDMPTRTPVILVTSTVPDEGKTTTALALARTYAQAGKKVLLVDSDLRKPSLHAFIGAKPSSGFLEYLRDPKEHTSLQKFASADPLSNLLLVLGRNRSSTPTDQLLTSVQFENVLKGAKRTFDVVVLDSPPLAPVVDGHYLAKHADVTVMVVRWASTGQRELRSVREPLRDSMKPGAHLLGLLSRKEGRRRGGYNYYYSYGDEVS